MIWSDPATGLVIEVEDNIDEKVQKLPEIKTTSKEIAEQIAAIAREIAPHQDGDYAAGIEVQETKTGHRVIATDQKSAWVEFGIPSHNQPAHWTLRTAVVQAGYKFKKSKGA